MTIKRLLIMAETQNELNSNHPINLSHSGLNYVIIKLYHKHSSVLTCPPILVHQTLIHCLAPIFKNSVSFHIT